MSDQKLGVFVSSRMTELASERQAIKAALADLAIDAWIFESDAGASPQPGRQTYLDEVEKADLFIGIFWLGRGRYTIDEYDHAQRLGKPCLVYEKRTHLEKREPELQEFIDRISDVEVGVTVRRFEEAEQLQQFVKEDVAAWQRDVIRGRIAVGDDRAVLWTRPTPFIIPTRNEERSIQRTLAYLLSDPRLGKSHIFVVDDGSDDGTIRAVDDLAALHPSRITTLTNLHPHERKMGGLRTAIEHLDASEDPSEFVVLLDADTRLDRVEADVTGGSKSMSTTAQEWAFDVCAFRVLPTETDSFLGRLGGADYAVSTDAIRNLLDSVPCVSGAGSLWRRSVLRDVLREHSGVFAGDDLELTLLTYARSDAIVYDARVLASTETPRSLRGWIRQRLRWDIGLIRNVCQWRSWKNVFLSRSRVAAVFRLIFMADILMHPLKLLAFLIPFVLYERHAEPLSAGLRALVQVQPTALAIAIAGAFVSGSVIRSQWRSKMRLGLLSALYLGAPYFAILAWHLLVPTDGGAPGFEFRTDFLVLSTGTDLWHFVRYYLTPFAAGFAAWWIPLTYLLLRKSSAPTYRRFGWHTVILPAYFLIHIMVIRTVAIMMAPFAKRVPASVMNPVSEAVTVMAAAAFLAGPAVLVVNHLSSEEQVSTGKAIEWIVDHAERVGSPDSNLVLYPLSYPYRSTFGAHNIWIYDASLAAMSMIVSGDFKSARAVMRGLETIQGADGSWFTVYTLGGRNGPVPADTLKDIVQNSWGVVAALQMREVTGDTTFDDMATRTLHWLRKQIMLSDGAQLRIRPIQTRQSCVAYGAFRLAAKHLGQEWAEPAERIRAELLIPAWNAQLGAFVERPGSAKLGSFDAQTLSILALADDDSLKTNLRRALSFLEESYVATVQVPMKRGFVGIKGFAYSAEEPNNVLGEGALQVAVSYRALGDLRRAAMWSSAAAQMRIRDGGVAYSVGANDQKFANLPALAPTAWWIMNEQAFNPLSLTH